MASRPGDVITVLRSLGDNMDEAALPAWAVEEVHGVLDGDDGERTVPEAWLGPEVRLGEDWRALGTSGPEDEDPRMV